MKRITNAFNVEEPTFTDIDDLISSVDIDGDGHITEEEFNELVGDIVNIIREEIQFDKLAKRA
jgi:Ca2+-binding EF-hand superfamily protein